MLGTVTSADGTTITYDRSGAGPAVIVVGGALMNRLSPQQTVQLLIERFTVYTYDRRGRGDSEDTQPYAPEREIEDLLAVVEHAGGAVRVFGMSSGSFIALQAAARESGISKVAVYEPPYLTGAGPLTSEEYRVRLEEMVEEGHPDEAVELFLRQVSGGWFDESLKKKPWWSGMVALGPSLRYDAALTGDGSVPTDLLRGIAVPVLVLYGGASDAWAGAAAEAVASGVPNGTVRRLDDQTHQVDEAVLAPALTKFFRD